MAYQSFFASKPSSTPTKQSNGASGYSSFFGGATIAQPSQAELKQKQAPVKPVAQPKPSQPSPAPRASLFSRVKTGVKDFASAATTGEQKLAQGIARDLPGGTNDLKAQQKAAEQDSKNLKTYTDLHKAGKISDAQYKKLTGTAAKQSSDTQKGTTAITKKMPTKAQIGLGAASTAADIVTAGTMPEIKGAVVGARTAKVAKFAKPATQVAGNAVAGGLNSAAGGGTKSDIIKNAAAGAILPEAIHYGAKGVSKLLPKAKVSVAATEELPTATHAAPQPGDVITPTVHTSVATPDHAKAVDDFIKQAHTENPVFQQNVGNVAKDLGLKYTPGPVKDGPRALTKVMEDYGGDHTKLKDTIRGTIEVPDHSQAGFQKVIDAIREKYPDSTVKDNYANYKNGYVDMKVNVKTPGGHTGEIILATPEMLAAKNKLGGHDLYDIARDSSKSPAERKAAHDQMMTLYDNAHASTSKRLASASDLPHSETKNLSASAGETGSPAPKRTPGTSLETPETTTVSRTNPPEAGRTASSTSSSVTKNDLSGASIPTTIAKDGENVKGKQNTPKMVDKPPLKPFETAHMESVGGYTHSTHMETDYADMLREQEQSVKGGQIVKNADGTYKRTSEHSRFYRDYFKEYGKAPTKEAYLEEARRQLASGKAAFGASDDYKTLLERENRPIPTMDVKTTPTVPKKEIAHTSGNSRVYERLKAEHPDTLSDDVQYDKLNLKEDAQKATDLVAKDKNKAYRVAMGAEDIKGQTNTAVNIALSEKALDEGNHSLYAQLVKNRSLEQTRRGQEIVAEKGSVTDNSTSRYVKELLAVRMQKLGKSFTSDINTKLVKTESSAKRAVATIDKEVAKAQKRIQYKQMDMKNAQSILEQLTCK